MDREVADLRARLTQRDSEAAAAAALLSKRAELGRIHELETLLAQQTARTAELQAELQETTEGYTTAMAALEDQLDRAVTAERTATAAQKRLSDALRTAAGRLRSSAQAGWDTAMARAESAEPEAAPEEQIVQAMLQWCREHTPMDDTMVQLESIESAVQSGACTARAVKRVHFAVEHLGPCQQAPIVTGAVAEVEGAEPEKTAATEMVSAVEGTESNTARNGGSSSCTNTTQLSVVTSTRGRGCIDPFAHFKALFVGPIGKKRGGALEFPSNDLLKLHNTVGAVVNTELVSNCWKVTFERAESAHKALLEVDWSSLELAACTKGRVLCRPYRERAVSALQRSVFVWCSDSTRVVNRDKLAPWLGAHCDVLELIPMGNGFCVEFADLKGAGGHPGKGGSRERHAVRLAGERVGDSTDSAECIPGRGAGMGRVSVSSRGRERVGCSVAVLVDAS